MTFADTIYPNIISQNLKAMSYFAPAAQNLFDGKKNHLEIRNSEFDGISYNAVFNLNSQSILATL